MLKNSSLYKIIDARSDKYIANHIIVNYIDEFNTCIETVSASLKANPMSVLSTIEAVQQIDLDESDGFYSRSFHSLLDDLIDKMICAGKQDELLLLFDNQACLEKIMDQGVKNVLDLQRIMRAIPAYRNKIATFFLSSGQEDKLKDLLVSSYENPKTPAELPLNYFCTLFPQHIHQFIEFYNTKVISNSTLRL
jgi:hypothetical protein